MAQQAVVTDYFTRKRQRDTLQDAKRKRTGPAVQSELEVEKSVDAVQEVKKKTREAKTAKAPTRVTRATTKKSKKSTNKTLDEYLSPKSILKQNSTVSEKSPAKDKISSKTSEPCSISPPVSPSKRSCNDTDEDPGKKRGRASPTSKEQNESISAQSNTMATLNKKSSQVKVTRNARKRLELKENKDDSKSCEQPTATNIEEDTLVTVKNKLSTRSLRTRGKQGDVSNAVNIAEKLLAKKKESKETIQESLKSKSNLKDLQETLLKMRDAKKKAKATKSKSKAEKESNKSAEVVKVVKKKDYAYSRFHTLAQEIPKGLALPFKYKILQEMFRSADTVIGMLFNRQETATWMKVQHSVKDMINKNFEKKDLGQIKHVFPEAYLYRQEKGIPTYSDHMKSSDYQLTLEPILDSEELELLENQAKKLTSGMLVRRRHHFHLQLLDIVKSHHQAFLSSLDPSVTVENSKLRRWHPQFKVDQVPDIPLDDLPLPPDHEQKKCYSAKEVLDKAKDRLTKKAVDALKKVAEKCVKTPDKVKEGCIEENNNVTPVKKTPKPAIKGVSKSLLDKIREKEADKKLRLMIRSDEDDKKLDMMRQLPDIAKALRMLFITEKKGALPLDYVAFKLIAACPSVCTSASSESYVRLMAKEADLLISIANIRKQEYVKLDKNVQLNDVVAQINNKVKVAERS
uniref:DNA replication factor Cdt1 n=1 Tax=Phallusia mammillata TaxID=59560 RepID=A0A6F9D9Q9_9ASCI|nr:DNA replication factor Cdt1 [Phallusia mammillata]